MMAMGASVVLHPIRENSLGRVIKGVGALRALAMALRSRIQKARSRSRRQSDNNSVEPPAIGGVSQQTVREDLPMNSAQVCSLLTAVSALVLVTPAHSAGFFDELARAVFGRPPPQVYPTEPLDVTVRPTRRQPHRKAVASKPPPPIVKLDPATDRYWYLDDPTLRRGDIVVTRSDVLVFEGRASQNHSTSDFTALGKSRLVSRSTQQRVEAAAGGRKFAEEPSPRTVAERDPAN